MIHASLEVCQAGDVLVVTTTSESTDGMFGELLAVSARARGVAGLVIDAGVRDVADITMMDFPVWAKAISAQGTVKATAGSVNTPVVCAGAIVRPGDVIVGDVDGVVVVSRGLADTVATLGLERVSKEEKSRERLRAGELGLDIYGWRARLAELGVRYLDEPELLRLADGLLEVIAGLSFPVDLWRAQNTFYALRETAFRERHARAATGDATAGEWCTAFAGLGARLGVSVPGGGDKVTS